MGSTSSYITPLVINSLRGGHTHTQTHTHMYIDIHGQSNSKKPDACQPQAGAPGLKMQITITYYSMNNLHVTAVRLLGGPAPAPVWAVSCISYTVSGDNPLIVSISMLLPKLVILIPLYWIEYCAIISVVLVGLILKLKVLLVHHFLF